MVVTGFVTRYVAWCVGVTLNKALLCCLALIVLSLPSRAQVVVGAGSTVDLGSGVVDYNCNDLIVAGTMLLSQAQTMDLDSLTILAGGELNAAAGTLAWSGDWANQGSFVSGTSSALWNDGCAVTLATMTGNQTFHALALQSNIGRELRFGSGQTQTVTTAFTATGSVGMLLPIRSTSAGNAGFMRLLGSASQSVFGIDVADNHAIGQPIGFPGPASNYGSVKGSNSTDWFELLGELRPLPAPVMSSLGLALLIATLALYARRGLTKQL
jgi:hypothetical protein